MTSLEEFLKINYKSSLSWPLRPSGTLKSPSRIPKKVDPITEKMRQEQEYITHFTNTFIQSRLNHVMWILSAAIGVLGNAIVSLAFSTQINASLKNLMIILGIFTLLILVLLARNYIEAPQFVIDFIPEYLDFPQGYNRYIDASKLTTQEAKIEQQFDTVEEYVRKFSNLVLMMILRDHIKEAMGKIDYLKISNVDILNNFSLIAYITITTNWKAMILPVSRKKIVTEFIILLGAITRCRILCNVLAFETDVDEWIKNGAEFFNTVIDWDFDNAINDIASTLKS